MLVWFFPELIHYNGIQSVQTLPHISVAHDDVENGAIRSRFLAIIIYFWG